MRAWQVHRLGEPRDVLTLAEVPDLSRGLARCSCGCSARDGKGGCGGLPLSIGSLGGAEGSVLNWAKYVALGDSLTAGRDDHGPGGGRIGWARRLAGMLSARTAVPCVLTSLAADGASVSVVLERQLPEVARIGPDLVSLTVGMNDIREPAFSEESFAAGLGRLLDGLTATGATTLTCTLPDIAGLIPLPAGHVALARQRMRRASDIIREQAALRGAACLDIWAMPGAADPGLFGLDRIHPNARGHQLMADAFAGLLLAGGQAGGQAGTGHWGHRGRRRSV